jgi:tRNA(Arg) A34 adenosine deaminase TadA
LPLLSDVTPQNLTDRDLTLLTRAVDLAWLARQSGNHPFGALLTDAEGAVVLEMGNTVVTGHDPTGHAEANVVRAAAAILDSSELEGASLYSSTEPCAMCAGAIYWAGIGRVVFALEEAELAKITERKPNLPRMALSSRVVFAACSRSTTVVGPAPAGSATDVRALAVHDKFWD